MTKKIKIKEFPRRLKKDSFNKKVFSAISNVLIGVVKGIGKAGDAYIDLFCGLDTTSIVQKFHGTYYAKIEDERIRKERVKEWQIKKALRDLQSMGYIKIEKDFSKIHLVDKGALEFIKYQIQERRQVWDGKWRIVVFDISEEERSKRDFLRRRLRWLGFKELQKSVWIFPYDIKREVEELLTICNTDITGDIRFLVVEKMEQDEDLKKEFNLV